MAEQHAGWARGRLGDLTADVARAQRALEAHLDEGFRVGAALFTGLLAELEADTRGAKVALARADKAMSLANQAEYRYDLPFLYRLRGNILLNLDPADIASAGAAFKTAIAIAGKQGARSPALQASLALAKLYQSTGRPVEAYGILAPALEGFWPTPEMPAIAEAQALLAALDNDGGNLGAGLSAGS
jgi:hypothetical protein